MSKRGRDMVVTVSEPDGELLDVFELTGTLWNVKTALRSRGYFSEGRIAVVRRARGRIPVAIFTATILDGRRHLWLRTAEGNERTFYGGGRDPR